MLTTTPRFLPDESTGSGLQFIYIDNPSSVAQQGNIKLARQHAARLNRNKYRTRLTQKRLAVQRDGEEVAIANGSPHQDQRSQLDCQSITTPGGQSLSGERCFVSPACRTPRSRHRIRVPDGLIRRAEPWQLSQRKGPSLAATSLDGMPPGVRQWSFGGMSEQAQDHCKLL